MTIESIDFGTPRDYLREMTAAGAPIGLIVYLENATLLPEIEGGDGGAFLFRAAMADAKTLLSLECSLSPWHGAPYWVWPAQEAYDGPEFTVTGIDHFGNQVTERVRGGISKAMLQRVDSITFEPSSTPRGMLSIGVSGDAAARALEACAQTPAISIASRLADAVNRITGRDEPPPQSPRGNRAERRAAARRTR